VNGQTKAEDLEITTALGKFCAEEHITLGIFAAVGNAQYDQTHSIHESFNETIFNALEATSTARKSLHRLRSASHRQAGAIPHDSVRCKNASNNVQDFGSHGNQSGNTDRSSHSNRQEKKTCLWENRKESIERCCPFPSLGTSSAGRSLFEICRISNVDTAIATRSP
jgi:hypothetical protein